MSTHAQTAPYIRAGNDVSAIMRQVIYALLPGTFALFWFFGWGAVSNLVLAIVFAGLLEALMLKLRHRPLQPFISDYSVVVTAWLLALSMPAFAPWWLILLGMAFAVILAKHIYGGLGQNPFNPAMVGYAALLISYPVEMTAWVTPIAGSFMEISLSQTLAQVFTSSGMGGWDGITQATPLDAVKTNIGLDQSIASTLSQTTLGWLNITGSGWEAISLAYLLGGLWLLYRRIISWHIPVTMLLVLAVIAGVFWLIDSDVYASPLFHLLSGGVMLGAFFIATDPVSASTTPVGKIVFAAGIAFFVYVIRAWGGYPDAIAFAVLLMNMAVPLIDYYTQPRVYGTPGMLDRWFGGRKP